MEPITHQPLHEEVVKSVLKKGFEEIRNWIGDDASQFLRAIFDQVGIKPHESEEDPLFTVPEPLYRGLSLPSKSINSALVSAKQTFAQVILESCQNFEESFLNVLTSSQLLYLLEVYGGTVPSEKNPGISVFDHYKVEAAKEVVAANRENSFHQQISQLINVRISGIQSFIYNIGSRNALKNLRARSFLVELLLHHVTDLFIKRCRLHPVNMIMNGGGTALLYSSTSREFDSIANQIDDEINQWLVYKFNGPLSLTIAYVDIDDQSLHCDLASNLENLSQLVFEKRRQRFATLIRNNTLDFIKQYDPAPERCELCYTDYLEAYEERFSDEQLYRCPICDRHIRLGSLIPRVRFIYEAEADESDCMEIAGQFYRLSEEQISTSPKWVIFSKDANLYHSLGLNSSVIFTEQYATPNALLPVKIKNLIKDRETELQQLLLEITEPKERANLTGELNSYADEHPAMLETLAYSSQGRDLIGALRMDADNLGKLLTHGFQGETTLERTAAFSRNINYLFRIVLNQVCAGNQGFGSAEQRYVHVVYAGGDDLFALGAWNDIADLAGQFSECFHKYTCNNIDIGISAGFTAHKPKYPVRQMAENSLAALNVAKKCCDPCWFCHENWLECPLNLNGDCLRKDAIVPFFEHEILAKKLNLDSEQKKKYTSQPSRLKMAFKRRHFDRKYKTAFDDYNAQVLIPFKAAMAIAVQPFSRGFLQNVLQMLDVWYSDGLLYLPRIAWLLQKQRSHLSKIMSGDPEDTLYDLSEFYFHFASPAMLSAMHVPLVWAILYQQGGENLK